MYCKVKIKEKKKIPFDIVCTNCGSHDVTVTAIEYWGLVIKCRGCNSCLSDCGRYNPAEYEEIK